MGTTVNGANTWAFQYMAVFSVSLVRLVYDMANTGSNPVLNIISHWMVLSVGIIDGLVYVSLFSFLFSISSWGMD